MSSQPNIYGGQAVIEGVMFGGRTAHVTAVRRKNNEISFLEIPKKEIPWIKFLAKIPFLRGLVSILDSAARGHRHLNFSAEVYAEEEGVPAEKEEGGLFSKVGIMLGVAVVGILSFLAGKLIFTVTPAVVEQLLFSKFFEDHYIIHNLIEGVIKIALLLAYIYAISFTPIIKRLFQYHGAEHKVISTYEAGVDLTVENVQKFSRLHYRCGSSFIVLTVIVGVIIYSFFPFSGMLERIIQRIVLLPVVIMVSYEVLRFTNSLRDTPVLRYLGYPGLWLQLLTTKEPDDSQVEVSIASFNRMRELDAQSALQPK